MLSPAIAQRTGVNKSVAFARWQRGRGLLCLAPQLVTFVDAADDDAIMMIMTSAIYVCMLMLIATGKATTSTNHQDVVR